MKKKIFSSLIFLLLITCSSDDSQPEEEKVVEYDKSEILKKDFSKKNMLIYWADYVIIPGYEDLTETSLVMNKAIEDFIATPSESSLSEARDSWLKAYLVWQKVSITQVGKARDLDLRLKLNAYPTNIGKMRGFIKKGSYDLSTKEMRFSGGFPALDYLLNGPDDNVSDKEIIEFYKKNTKYATYIKDVSKEVSNVASSVSDYFKNTYRAKFIKKYKNNHISSVKQVAEYFTNEIIDNQFSWYKINRPSGNNGSKQSIETLESRYKKDISRKLYYEAVHSAINFYNGKSYDGKVTGFGLKQYLVFLNRKELDDNIIKQFDKVLKVSEENLKENFFEQLSNPYGKGEFRLVSNEFYKLLKLFKMDLLPAIGIGANGGGDSDND